MQLTEYDTVSYRRRTSREPRSNRRAFSLQNPVATAFEIFWMICEPILFGVTGAQIKIDELEGKTVYLGVSCLLAGIIIRIVVTILVGIGSKLNLKEKVFIALSWMAKATVQAALAPTTLDKVDPNDPEQVYYAETMVTMCVLSILLTAPAGAIIISLTGPKLLKKTTVPTASPEGWKARRPSIRDISIINEDPDLEETATERKAWGVPLERARTWPLSPYSTSLRRSSSSHFAFRLYFTRLLCTSFLVYQVPDSDKEIEKGDWAPLTRSWKTYVQICVRARRSKWNESAKLQRSRLARRYTVSYS